MIIESVSDSKTETDSEIYCFKLDTFDIFVFTICNLTKCKELWLNNSKLDIYKRLSDYNINDHTKLIGKHQYQNKACGYYHTTNLNINPISSLRCPILPNIITGCCYCYETNEFYENNIDLLNIIFIFESNNYCNTNRYTIKNDYNLTYVNEFNFKKKIYISLLDLSITNCYTKL